jgi:hypothetical protein
MSCAGDCYNDAVMVSFFGTLKTECIAERYPTRVEHAPPSLSTSRYGTIGNVATLPSAISARMPSKQSMLWTRWKTVKAGQAHFYRADEAKTDRKAGLGLSIAHKIIKAYHGSIEVESELGKGSIFTVILPINPL